MHDLVGDDIINFLISFSVTILNLLNLGGMLSGKILLLLLELKVFRILVILSQKNWQKLSARDFYHYCMLVVWFYFYYEV